ncbi:LOW QUALITY PROTEIN: hypothetical protein MAR_035877 [Mya arenaria]|uniref:Uncharacterized protein n=1 Tax=Mya arenaria TaxID=6604 RepID=A0ABY7EPR7_MYAAR|nr:LOW QUALITY PROTEIN: hypothetical protein MAR_035877 [Mya arenaria]
MSLAHMQLKHSSQVTSQKMKEKLELSFRLKEIQNLQINEQMKKVAFAFSNARNVSPQEAAYIILGLPLYVSNFTTVWIPYVLPENRIRILKPNEQLNAMKEDDENVFSANIIDRFSARPSQIKDI